MNTPITKRELFMIHVTSRPNFKICLGTLALRCDIHIALQNSDVDLFWICSKIGVAKFEFAAEASQDE
jgi:hypothetical protein